MSGVVDWGVEEAETGWEPSLFHLGVDVNSATQVSVDAFENCGVNLRVVILENVVEHNFQVGVVGEVLREASGRGRTVQGNVLEGKGSGLVRLGSREVGLHGG